MDNEIFKGTFNYSLCFGGAKPNLVYYTDSYMANDIDTRRSTSGYVFTFGGAVMSQQSKLQKCVTISSTTAEYIFIIDACKEILWLMNFFKELKLNHDEYIIHRDSQSVIYVDKNAPFHTGSKHTSVRYYWIQNVLEK